MSHLFQFVIHFTDTESTVTLTTFLPTSPLLQNSWLIVHIPRQSGMTTSAHFTDTQGLASYERSTRNFKEEANADNYRKILAEQSVYRRGQGRNALNFPQAGFERAAQEDEQAAHDMVHAAVAQATEMSRAEMQELMRALKAFLLRTSIEAGAVFLSRRFVACVDLQSAVVSRFSHSLFASSCVSPVAWSPRLVTMTSSDAIEQTLPSTLKDDEETSKPEAAVEAYRHLSLLLARGRKRSSTVVDTNTDMAAVGVSGSEAATGTACLRVRVSRRRWRTRGAECVAEAVRGGCGDKDG